MFKRNLEVTANSVNSEGEDWERYSLIKQILLVFSKMIETLKALIFMFRQHKIKYKIFCLGNLFSTTFKIAEMQNDNSGVFVLQ